MLDDQGDDRVTAEGFARAEGISTQTVIKKGILPGIIPAERNDRGYYLFRREAVPAEWLAAVKARRDLRWGAAKRQTPRRTVTTAPVADSVVMADTLVFLRGQLTAKDEQIDRLLRLLEARSE